MSQLTSLAEKASALVISVSRAAALCLVPLLFVSALIPMIGRNINAPWTSKAGFLQPVQSPLFFGIVMFSLGLVYLRDEHVRIDLFRRHFSPIARAWVDLMGMLLVLLPFSIALIWYGGRFTREAFLIGESSDVVLDFPVLWLVKATIPLGGLLLLLAGLKNALRDAATVLHRPWPPAQAIAEDSSGQQE